MNTNSYVYMFVDHEHIPIYVGKGTGDRHRLSSHYHNAQLAEYVRVVGYFSIKTIILMNGLSQDDAFTWERYWISYIGRKDTNNGTLFNKTDGGFGGRGRQVSQEVRDKIAASLFGRKQSQATRRLKSLIKKGKDNGCRGKHHSSEAKARIASFHKGRQWALGHRWSSEERLEISKRMKEIWERRKAC